MDQHSNMKGAKSHGEDLIRKHPQQGWMLTVTQLRQEGKALFVSKRTSAWSRVLILVNGLSSGALLPALVSVSMLFPNTIGPLTCKEYSCTGHVL